MFNNCNSLQNINIRAWDTSSMTNIGNLFYNCSSLTHMDLSGWDTRHVTRTDGMFNGCSVITKIDMNTCNTRAVTNMDNMFNGCSSLEILDISNFNTSGSPTTSGMFSNCILLKNIGAIYCNNNTLNVLSTQLATDMPLVSGINIYLENTNIDGLPTLNNNWTFKQQKINTESIYLPIPLRMKGDKVDILYWDDAMHQYRIIKQVTANRRVNSSITNRVGVETFNPDLYIRSTTPSTIWDDKINLKATVPFTEYYETDVNVSYLAYRFSTVNSFAYKADIKFDRGDYIEALIDLSTCTTDNVDILSVGELIDYEQNMNKIVFKYSPSIQILQIIVYEVDNATPITYNKTLNKNILLLRLDKTGIYVNDRKVSYFNDQLTYNNCINGLSEIRNMEVGQVQDHYSEAYYKWIRIIRNIQDGDLNYNYYYQTVAGNEDENGITIESDNLDIGNKIRLYEIKAKDGEILGELQEDGTYKIEISSTSAFTSFEE